MSSYEPETGRRRSRRNRVSVLSPDLFPSDGEDDELEVDSDGSEDTSSESEDTSSDEETDGDEEGGAASSENDSASGRSATAAVPDDSEPEELLTLSTPCTQAWNWQRDKDHVPLPQNFDEFNSGFACHLPEDATELDALKIVFTEAAVKLVIDETNLYAAEQGTRDWKELEEEELWRYLAVRIIMGISKKPQLKHYWASDPLIHQPLVPQIMRRDRFFKITSQLHFANDGDNTDDDKLYKIMPIWDICNARFSELLVPHQPVCVDETLVSHKGRLSFKQLIPSKRSRFGIKCFSLVDSTTGFVLRSKIYCGKGTAMKYSIREYGYGGAIVLELLEGYYNKNHVLYADNFFTSPILAIKLLEVGTFLCGTLRKGRKNAAVPPRKITKREVEVFSANSVMCEFWMDKKIVRVISTAHEHGMVDVTKRRRVMKKPQSVVDYNKWARGIDQSDMQMHFDTVKRKTRWWHRKMFFHLIDLCMLNSFKIFKTAHENAVFLDFKMGLVREIMKKHGVQGPPPSLPDFDRLKGRHFPACNAPTKGKSHGSRKCVVCVKKSKGGDHLVKYSSYCCKVCSVSLCVVPSFELFHSKKHF